jgi:hypothetical protein
MAEVKNTFLSSKMNLDFDDRLIPNGQYRQATNIAVGKSEDEDVGALENIIGNILVPKTDLRRTLNKPDIDCIGNLPDNNNNRILLFITDWDGALGDNAPANSYCAIYLYNYNNGDYTILVEGAFLNFSKLNPIYGISLIEDLLFWVDNRNQPRKINIALASAPSYYTTEVQISVAKYNPYEPISLIKKVITTVKLPLISSTEFNVTSAAGIEVGMTLLCSGKANGSDYLFVTNISDNKITIDSPISTPLAEGDELVFLISTMSNKESIPTWPGDPDYIKSRYIRLGYRFKFDDSEYSITSPFTQIAYIPEQKGFFVAGDEDAAYRSTILNFMQNNVQNIELLIPLPDKLGNIANSYKILEIDILYKESDQTVIKVLDTISISDTGLLPNINTLAYNYQSRKPYKTLPESQTVRVYDKVPTRALAQETSGNRVIYGNYRDVYTPPANINYTVGIAPKVINYASEFTSFIEYPNHTLKENRNYQVGFILSDKYGRQSPVILSSVDLLGKTVGGTLFGGSTIYSPYKTISKQPNLFDWFGDALQVSVNSPITSGNNGRPSFSTGEPGMYAIPSGGKNGFSINLGVVVNNTYAFTQDGSTVNNDVPIVGNYLRGKYNDYVKVIPNLITDPTPVAPSYFIRTDGAISDTYNHNLAISLDTKFGYIINEIGWYSYKVVVKQLEQDYYNCYLPGILNGYPQQFVQPAPPATQTVLAPFPAGEANKTAHIVLLNDNINKIPRDLSEVGPDQKQYRSSVLLYGRVQNTTDNNVQYYPGRTFDVASAIANAPELNMEYSVLGPLGQDNFYQLGTKPIIARISTAKSIGVTTATMLPFLAVYETKPIESLLTIYWETSNTGLLSDLNENVLTGYAGPNSFSSIEYLQKEWQDPNGTNEMIGEPDSKWISDSFYVLSLEGLQLPDISISSFIVTNGSGLTVTDRFGYTLDNGIGGDYSLRLFIKDSFTYGTTSSVVDKFLFTFGVDYLIDGDILSNVLKTTGVLTNITPSYTVTPTQMFNVTQDNDIVGYVLGGVNGGHATTTTELYWTLTNITGPANGLTPTPFSINSATGLISQTLGSTRVFGNYVLTITLTDATTSSGVLGTGSILFTGTVEVSIGETTLNIGIPNSSSPVICEYPGTAFDNTGRVVRAWPTQTSNNNTAAAWFVGNSDVTTTTLPSQWTDLPADKKLNSPYVLGSSVTKGTLGLTISAQIRRDAFGEDPIYPPEGNLEWKIFYRPNSSTTWVESFMDINNCDYSLTAAGFGVLKSPIELQYISEAQTRAYDKPGEYFILVYNIISIQNGANTILNSIGDTMRIWVNAFDLFYENTDYCTTCVGPTPPIAPKNSWNYRINPPGSLSRSCTNPWQSIWTNTPYLQYARSFFTTSDLNVLVYPDMYISATPNLYYTIDQVFPTVGTPTTYNKQQHALPPKVTLMMAANGTKQQTINLSAPFSQFCDVYAMTDYTITSTY